ncbi:hypothetical protein [Roseovarius atlanticus]|nr:hypothetical protein [Roseovarius atlanticus]
MFKRLCDHAGPPSQMRGLCLLPLLLGPLLDLTLPEIGGTRAQGILAFLEFLFPALDRGKPAPKRLSRADAEEVVARLRACTDGLLGALGTPANNIDRAYKAPELDAAMRWHAAQLTDLERDLKRAFGLS